MNCKLELVFGSWILISFMPVLVASSHFVGAAVSWRPGQVYAEGKKEILVDYRIAWRRSHMDATQCSDADILNKKLLAVPEADIKWNCTKGCKDFSPTNRVVCSEFDEDDDWSIGYGTASTNITGDLLFAIEYTGCCWITSLMYGGQGWKIGIVGNLNDRSDTKQANTPPTSSVAPVIRFQAGCPDNLDIVMYDSDGDDVSCRLATEDECKDKECTSYPYFKITKQTNTICRLSYNGGGPAKINVLITLVLEDYPTDPNIIVGSAVANGTFLSSVSIQFFVKLIELTDSCNLKPTWKKPTPSNGLVTAAVANQPFQMKFTAESTYEVTKFSVTGASGVVRSAIIADSSSYSIDVTWTPTLEESGSSSVCVTAMDDRGKMSEQRCVVVLVAESGSPCQLNNGGCSDNCVSSGVSYYCGCTDECWHLAEDNRTCLPNMQIACNTNNFTVVLDKCAVTGNAVTIGARKGVEVDRLTDQSELCLGTLNGTHFVSDVSYSSCNTRTDEDFLEIHYRNQVGIWLDDAAENGSGQSVITRGFWYNIQLVCSFNKYGFANGSYLPIDRKNREVFVPGLGSFQFFFDFYVNENFEYAYSPYAYPITVTVNSDIYFGIRVSGGTGVEVFTEKCIAMTTQTLTNSTISYTMIEDGCPLDNTLKKHDAQSELEEWFSIKAFRFQEKLITESQQNIYIQCYHNTCCISQQCSAILCVLGQLSTKCQKTCIQSRKRRDENDQIYLEHQIHTREKRQVENEPQPTFASNITESNILQITVSGPFRIEVIPASKGAPGVTVVTPISEKKKEVSTTSTQQVVGVPPKPNLSDNLIIKVVAGLAGSFIFLIILLSAAFVTYHYLFIRPKTKIIPVPMTETHIVTPTPAWTCSNEAYYEYDSEDDKTSKHALT